MANITDIAKELGIAPSTVSRALKKPDLVSLDTRHKVLQMAEKLGYLQKLRDDATAATATNLIKRMKTLNIVEPVVGAGKGKYVLRRVK